MALSLTFMCLLSGVLRQGEPWAAPALERAIVVRDGASGARLGLDELLGELARADAVFLGETHTDETTHRVELAVYAGLLELREGRVVLALEMFERDVQPELDAYLAGELDEAAFLGRSRPWSNYRTAYRPLVERARGAGGPVVAANFPAPLIRRIAMEGREVLEGLADSRQAPAQLFPNTEAYWRRVDNAIRSHRSMMAASRGDDEQRLYTTQTLRDNSMGEACALAIDEHPGHVVLLVNGGFHSAYWDGAVHQFRLRKPEASVRTVAVATAANPATVDLAGAPVADYVVLAEARATDLFDGRWAVHVDRELKYRFHLPEPAASEGAVPLLIWLGDDGFTAADGLDLWRERLGARVAIAVLEPPYREQQEDLGQGGRWYWPDTFSEDVGAVREAVERAWAYLLRHFPIDSAAVCIAGEGSGATVAASTALLTERIAARAVAFGPRAYAKVKDFALPLPELRGDDPAPERTLAVVAGEADAAWWGGELEEYRAVGLPCELVPRSDDPWRLEAQAEGALCAALGIEFREPAASGERAYVLAPSESPRARHWARLLALRHAAAEGVPVAVLEAPPSDESARPIDVDVRPERYAAPGALPRCPGSFGGTTVLVVPDGAPAEELAAWVALEEDDPIAKTSRFHRLRVASASGERGLSVVLEELDSQGRENVLVVPAVFCADGATMRALRRSARALEDRMTLQWLPGLGGRPGSE